MTQKQFTCAVCGDQCITELSEADAEREAEQEAEALWGVKDARTDPRMALVCDECWEAVRPDREVRH